MQRTKRFVHNTTQWAEAASQAAVIWSARITQHSKHTAQHRVQGVSGRFHCRFPFQFSHDQIHRMAYFSALNSPAVIFVSFSFRRLSIVAIILAQSINFACTQFGWFVSFQTPFNAQIKNYDTLLHRVSD